MVIHLKKEERQRLQLFHAEYTQVVRASQDEQGAIKKRRLKVLMTQPVRPKNAASKEMLLPAGLSKS